MYLSELPNVFVQIAQCICPNRQMYFSKLSNVFVQIIKYICPNCQIYLSKLTNVFVQELFGDYIMSPKFVSGTSPPRTLRTSCLLSEEIL